MWHFLCPQVYDWLFYKLPNGDEKLLQKDMCILSNLECPIYFFSQIPLTNARSKLDRGCIAIFSPLTVANAFVCCVHWAGLFTCSGQNALMHRYVTMCWHIPSKVTPPVGPYLIHVSVDPHESAAQTAYRSVQPFMHSSPMWP